MTIANPNHFILIKIGTDGLAGYYSDGSIVVNNNLAEEDARGEARSADIFIRFGEQAGDFPVVIARDEPELRKAARLWGSTREAIADEKEEASMARRLELASRTAKAFLNELLENIAQPGRVQWERAGFFYITPTDDGPVKTSFALIPTRQKNGTIRATGIIIETSGTSVAIEDPSRWEGFQDKLDKLCRRQMTTNVRRR